MSYNPAENAVLIITVSSLPDLQIRGSTEDNLKIISLPGQSPGRAVVLPPALAPAGASALAKC